MKQKGFTLIELLVVIAIIGILAQVILVSLNSARLKGADASIEANLVSARIQAESLFDTDGSYVNICSDAIIVGSITSAINASGINPIITTDLSVGGTSNTAVCHVLADGSAWAVDVPLKTDNTNSWCVDSTGASKQMVGYLTASGAISDVVCQ